MKRNVAMLTPNDIIRFTEVETRTNFILCRVTKIKKYKSFYEMLTSVGYKLCIPNANNIEEAENIYKQFPGYTEGQNVYGVAAIYIEIVE